MIDVICSLPYFISKVMVLAVEIPYSWFHLGYFYTISIAPALYFKFFAMYLRLCIHYWLVLLLLIAIWLLTSLIDYESDDCFLSFQKHVSHFSINKPPWFGSLSSPKSFVFLENYTTCWYISVLGSIPKFLFFPTWGL
jgi:hypothetical protein